MSDRRVLVLDAEGEIGRWLRAMTDARDRTLELVDGLSDGDLDRGDPNTISSVLYHLAAIEADWLYDEILGALEEIPEDLFPYDVREEGGVLTRVTGMSLGEHLDRLSTVRSAFVEHVSALDEPAFHRPRSCPNYDVSPAYVLHHLLQHEAEHRSEIARARRS